MGRGSSDKSLNELRVFTVDTLWRQGFSATEIAKIWLTDEECLGMGLAGDYAHRNDLSFPQKVRSLVPVVNNCINTVKARLSIPLDPKERQKALEEYVAREDLIFNQAWRDHQNAFDYRDKLTALKLAQEAAKNKARAMGVILTPDPDQPQVGSTTHQYITIENLAQMALVSGQVSRERIGDGNGPRPALNPASN
jgi:hypothetical protein